MNSRRVSTSCPLARTLLSKRANDLRCALLKLIDNHGLISRGHRVHLSMTYENVLFPTHPRAVFEHRNWRAALPITQVQT